MTSPSSPLGRFENDDTCAGYDSFILDIESTNETAVSSNTSGRDSTFIAPSAEHWILSRKSPKVKVVKNIAMGGSIPFECQTLKVFTHHQIIHQIHIIQHQRRQRIPFQKFPKLNSDLSVTRQLKYPKDSKRRK